MRDVQQQTECGHAYGEAGAGNPLCGVGRQHARGDSVEHAARGGYERGGVGSTEIVAMEKCVATFRGRVEGGGTERRAPKTTSLFRLMLDFPPPLAPLRFTHVHTRCTFSFAYHRVISALAVKSSSPVVREGLG